MTPTTTKEKPRGLNCTCIKCRFRFSFFFGRNISAPGLPSWIGFCYHYSVLFGFVAIGLHCERIAFWNGAFLLCCWSEECVPQLGFCAHCWVPIVVSCAWDGTIPPTAPVAAIEEAIWVCNLKRWHVTCAVWLGGQRLVARLDVTGGWVNHWVAWGLYAPFTEKLKVL